MNTPAVGNLKQLVILFLGKYEKKFCFESLRKKNHFEKQGTKVRVTLKRKVSK
jgi:hypothetical protein